MKSQHIVQLAKTVALAAIVMTALLTGYEEMGALVAALVAGGGSVAGSLMRSPRDAVRKSGPMLLVVACVLGGCGGAALQSHARAADATAIVINTATDAAETGYERRQREAIERACGSADPELVEQPCQAEARAAVDGVRDRWAPVWTAQETLEDLHRRWVDAIALAVAQDEPDPLRWDSLAADAVAAYAAFAERLRRLDVEVPGLPRVVRTMGAQ